MARRPLAGRDRKIIQGQRRDAFFAKMRRKGGVPRMPNQAPQGVTTAADDETVSTVSVDDETAATASADEAEPAAEDEAQPAGRAAGS